MQGMPLVFCQEKLFKIKDDIRIYADSSKKVELLRIKQRNIMDWAALFDVFDPLTNAKIGAFRRKGWRSWLRDEWHLLDTNDQQVGTILETGNAFLRRVFKFLPYTFAFNVAGQQVGTFNQHFAFIGYKATMDIGAWRGRAARPAHGLRRRAPADGGGGQGGREPVGRVRACATRCAR